MATITATRMTVQEFDLLYGSQNGWEYWFGEARRKPLPTYLHGPLSLLLGDLLRRAGYFVSTESDLKISLDWQPRPDVFGVLDAIEGKYATKPVDVVFEVESAGDETAIKCQHYTQIGIPQVFAFNPEIETLCEWNGSELVRIEDVHLANGVTITGRTIWSEMNQRRRERLEPPASKTI